MNFLLFLPYYFRWHYTKAISELFFNLRNGLLFVLHFFSIPVLFKTLFSPWKRLGEDYKKGLDLGAFFSTLIVNLLLRMVGFIVRLLTIVVGTVALAISVCLAIALTIVWLFFPIILSFIFALSIISIF